MLSKVKLDFSIKKKNELKNLTHEELLEYTEILTDDWHKQKEKQKKDSTNSSIPPSTEIVSPKKIRVSQKQI